jgi:hypothetical protein
MIKSTITDLPDLTGLIWVARTGVGWKWLRYSTTSDGIPLCVWQAPCRACLTPFEVTTTLPPARVRRKFFDLLIAALADIDALPDAAERRAARARLEIRIPVPADRRVRAFDLRNCEQDRWSRRDARAEALV